MNQTTYNAYIITSQITDVCNTIFDIFAVSLYTKL